MPPGNPPRDALSYPVPGIESPRTSSTLAGWSASRLAEAVAAASSAWDRWERLGFRLAARSAAVVGAIAEARGELAEARTWRARAIERLLPTQDRLLAGRLFRYWPTAGRSVGPLAGRRALRAACVIVPQMLGDGERRRAGRNRAGTALLDAAVSPSSIAAGRPKRFRLRALRRKKYGADAEMLALTLTALTGGSWHAAFDGLRLALADCAAKLRPAARRTISIAVPVSQSASIEHLKFDVRRSGRIEYLADLHVRILSFRPGTGAALDGGAVPLTGRLTQLLVLLIHSNGNVIDKETIATEIWPDAP